MTDSDRHPGRHTGSDLLNRDQGDVCFSSGVKSDIEAPGGRETA